MIGIWNLEPKYFNLALEKVQKYYIDIGENVSIYKPLWHNQYDKIYCSSIFTFTQKPYIPNDVICGGTGFDLTTTLAPEIEAVKVKKNTGFTTRGCIRNCPFCFVPKKEGKIRVVGDIYDLWDGKSKNITLYDNNILALPRHFSTICSQLRKENLRVDFNQGLDHRLLTQEIVSEIKTIRHKGEFRFAYDDVKYRKSVKQAIDLLQKNGIKRSMWYVLVGFNSTFEEEMDRLEYLKSRNQIPYVQRYNLIKHKDKRYISLSRWANQRHLFMGMTWKQFLDHPDNKKYKDLLTNCNQLQ